MGFPLELCSEADENHLAEYICVICVTLVESPVLTECQHVFCAGCLEQWVGRTQHRCPTCSATLHGTPKPLQQASPLAWRVLGRVRVSCPLTGCEWKGEYSEVNSHLTNSESHLLEGASGMREQAELKAESRQFKEAITLYSKALAGSKDALTLIGRGRAWLQLDQPTQAAADARAAIALDASCSPAHSLLARALVQLGEFDAASRALSSVPVKDASLAEVEGLVYQLLVAEREGTEAYKSADFAQARECFAGVLKHTQAHSIQLWLAKSELGLGLCDQAIRRTREVLREAPNNGSAFMVRGMAYYLQAEFEQAWKHLQEALRLDPDDAATVHAAKKARKVQRAAEGAKAAAFKRNFEEAVALASQAIETADAPMRAPLRAMLYSERAAARLRLKEYAACLEDAAQAINGSDSECKAASLTRASALHALNRHEEALADMAALIKLYEHDVQIKHAYHRANFEVRKIRRKKITHKI